METETTGHLRIPLDDDWQLRWDGFCYNLIRVRDKDLDNRFAREKGAVPGKVYVIDSYCGSDLGGALALYANRAAAESNRHTSTALLAKLADIERAIVAVLERLSK